MNLQVMGNACKIVCLSVCLILLIPFYNPHMVPDFVLAFLAVSGR